MPTTVLARLRARRHCLRRFAAAPRGVLRDLSEIVERTIAYCVIEYALPACGPSWIAERDARQLRDAYRQAA